MYKERLTLLFLCSHVEEFEISESTEINEVQYIIQNNKLLFIFMLRRKFVMKTDKGINIDIQKV
jgi:hypothetical protein